MKGLSAFRGIPTKIIVVSLVILALVVAALIGINEWEKRKAHFAEQEANDSYLEYEGETYILRENVETFLVLGLDKFEGTASADSYNNDMQADFLLLFVFDNDTKKYSAIHINRDTIADVNVLGVAGNKISTVKQQIALAHTYGNGKDVSCHNTADAVSALLGNARINHYISLTLDAVPVFNDLVGGVELEILDDFTGIDNTLVKGNTVTLMGEQALRYVRSRSGLDDSTNSNRMIRQRQYMNALYQKAMSEMSEDENFIIDASVKMSDYMISDRSVTQLQTLANKFNEYEFEGIRALEGESKNGEQFVEFYPDEEHLMQTVIELFYKKK